MTSLIEVNGPMKGQWAMITGSSAGIGKACAITLAKAGINVYLTGRNEAALKEVQTSCKDFGVEAEYLVGDLSSRAFVKELVDWSQEAAIFINN